jgi:enoyl-CoA hydratase/carnithine racemase
MGLISARLLLAYVFVPLDFKPRKEAFYRQLEMPLADAYDYTARVMATNMTAEDAQEGISAFLDKRDPNWQHK